MNQPADGGGNQSIDESRIVALTREIAGAQGLATLLRQIWKEADPEDRKKLVSEMIVSIAGNTYMLRDALTPIAFEVAAEKDVKEQLRAAIEVELPRIIELVKKEAISKIEEASRRAVGEALKDVMHGRRW